MYGNADIECKCMYNFDTLTCVVFYTYKKEMDQMKTFAAVLFVTVIMWDQRVNATTVIGTCAFDTCAWTSGYCQNGGSCSLDKATCAAVCACRPGFRGDRCQSPLGESSESVVVITTSVPPSSVAKPASSSCVFNPCSSIKYCLNNGTCSVDETTCLARCECRDGFTGSRCQDNSNTAVTSPITSTTSKVVPICAFNPCTSIFNPCQNNGKCILNNTTCTFSCACLEGHTGTRCEIEDDDGSDTSKTTQTLFCTFNPCTAFTGFCQNNGTCTIDRTTCIAKCACKSGFSGNKCENEANPPRSTTRLPTTTTKTKRTCAFDPCVWSTNFCKNGGKCKLNENTCLSFCTCSTGYTGERCDKVVGTGSTTTGQTTTSERTCAFDICAWSASYCHHGGTCFLDKRTCMAKCRCPDGFSGARCEDKMETTTESEGCLDDPCETEYFCLQDGECVTDHSTCTTSCKCPIGYNGTRCETETERTTQGTNITVTSPEGLSQAYNVCQDDALERTVKERVCEPPGPRGCVYGTCKRTFQTEGQYKGYKYDCVCDPGAQGTFCELQCCLDCGSHGRCRAYKALEEDGNVTQICECRPNWDGEFCDYYIPLPVRVEFTENTWYLWVVGVCVGTFLLLLLLAVVTPYWMWRHRVILIMKIVHYFQAYEDEDEKEWDAFVSYKADEVDERYVVQVLYPKLERELGFRLCLHFRDFVPGETISNNIINAVEGSRRTILILTPRYIKSEFTRFEYQKAQEEMLKRKHRIIPIVLEDISECKPAMDKNLKGIIGSVTYLEWPSVECDIKQDKFWKRLQLSMPKKKVSDLIPGEKLYGSSQPSSIHANGNIYSDGYVTSNIQSDYMEIGEVDENMTTVIRPLSETEEMELANSSKPFSENDTVNSSEGHIHFKETRNGVKHSNLQNNLTLNVDDLKISLTDDLKMNSVNLGDKDPAGILGVEYIV